MDIAIFFLPLLAMTFVVICTFFLVLGFLFDIGRTPHSFGIRYTHYIFDTQPDGLLRQMPPNFVAFRRRRRSRFSWIFSWLVDLWFG